MAAALIPFLITACSDIPQTEADNWTELSKGAIGQIHVPGRQRVSVG